jgi:hypothetical protein
MPNGDRSRGLWTPVSDYESGGQIKGEWDCVRAARKRNQGGYATVPAVVKVTVQRPANAAPALVREEDVVSYVSVTYDVPFPFFSIAFVVSDPYLVDAPCLSFIRGITMRWVAVSAVLMLVGLPALWASDDVKGKPKEPTRSKADEDVNALIETYENAVNDYSTKNQENFKNAKTDEERLKIRDAAPKPDETIDKLWALLEKNPNDKEASLSAFQWLLQNYDFGEKGQKGRARVLDLLIKDHAADVKYDPENPKIVHILDDLIGVYSEPVP